MKFVILLAILASSGCSTLNPFDFSKTRSMTLEQEIQESIYIQQVLYPRRYN